ncbi:MAG: hypothetical protein ACOCP4_00325 [Candidatus Woesearchaeota archaeon]
MISDFIEQMKKENSNLDYDKIMKALNEKHAEENYYHNLNNNEKSMFNKIKSLIKKDKPKKSIPVDDSFSDDDSSLEKLHKVESVNNLILEEIKELIQVTNSLNEKIDGLKDDVHNLENRIDNNNNKIDKVSSKNSKTEKRVGTLGQNLRNFLKIYDKDRSRLKKTLYSDFEYLKDMVKDKKD